MDGCRMPDHLPETPARRPSVVCVLDVQVDRGALGTIVPAVLLPSREHPVRVGTSDSGTTAEGRARRLDRGDPSGWRGSRRGPSGRCYDGRIESVIRTRRQWLQTVTMLPACLVLRAARKNFWESKDPASWSNDEKQLLLGQSPWAQEGLVRMEEGKDRRTTAGYGANGKPGGAMPDIGPGVPPGGVRSVPIGEPVPKPPNPDPGHPVQFRVLARWESAKPVRLAGGLELPELTGEFYVIRLLGLPLMPPPKTKPEEVAPNPNEAMLQAIKEGSSLVRKDKPSIPSDHLLTGAGDAATEVLLFFPRGADPIQVADKLVTLESRFAPFHLSVKFPLKDMMFEGELAL